MGEFLILLNSVGGMGARWRGWRGCMGSWVVWRVWVEKREWCGSKLWYGWSGPEALCWKIIIKSFAKFTGKHLCWSLFLNKVAGWRPANLLKIESPAQVFPCEIWKNFKNICFVERLHTFTTVLFISFPVNN